MTHTKQFIEDIIEGGWSNGYQMFGLFGDGFFEIWNEANTQTRYTFEQVLLQPSAWKAVGKVRGWDFYTDCSNPEHINRKVDCPECEYEHEGTYKHKQKQFITHLQDGKSIEEALEAISK